MKKKVSGTIKLKAWGFKDKRTAQHVLDYIQAAANRLLKVCSALEQKRDATLEKDNGYNYPVWNCTFTGTVEEKEMLAMELIVDTIRSFPVRLCNINLEVKDM